MISLNRVESAVLAVLFTLLLFGTYFSRTNLAYFEQVYIIEDGLIETLSVIALLVAAATCLIRFFILRRHRPALFSAALLFLAAGFIFGAGEEISWGQRIFDVKSPEFFQANNSQAETNLHNLVLGGVRINKVIFGALLALIIVVYVIVWPQLYRRVPKIRQLTDAWAVPVPRGVHALCYLAAFAIVSTVVSRRHGELLELTGCTLFALIVLFPANRAIFSRTEAKRV